MVWDSFLGRTLKGASCKTPDYNSLGQKGPCTNPPLPKGCLKFRSNINTGFASESEMVTPTNVT